MKNNRHERQMKLLGILQEYAPNASAQQICSNYYNDAKKDGNDDNALERLLIGAIYDGLAYGNWVWINFSNRR